MRGLRNRLIASVRKKALDSMGENVVKAIQGEEASVPGWKKWLLAIFLKNRHNLIWFGIILIFIVLELLNFLFLNKIFGWHRFSVWSGSGIFGLFLGGTFFWYFPAKLLTTLIGGLVGIKISEISSGASLISKINEAVTDIAIQINLIASSGATDSSPDPLVNQAVWVCLGCIILPCLPAFGRDE